MKNHEREWLAKVSEMGCIACLHAGIIDSPAEIHHVRAGQGLSQRSDHVGGVIPLCPTHHRNGGYGVALHAGQSKWEGIFGTEADLLIEVNSIL